MKKALALISLLTLTATACGESSDDSAPSPELPSPTTPTVPTEQAPQEETEEQIEEYTDEYEENSAEETQDDSANNVDNVAACNEILNSTLIADVPDVILRFHSGEEPAQQEMIDMHSRLQLLINGSEGELQEALIELDQPFREFNEAVVTSQLGGPSEVYIDTDGSMTRATEVMNICLEVYDLGPVTR